LHLLQAYYIDKMIKKERNEEKKMEKGKRVELKQTCFILGGMGTIIKESVYQGLTTCKVKMDDGRIIYKDKNNL